MHLSVVLQFRINASVCVEYVPWTGNTDCLSLSVAAILPTLRADAV